MTIPSSAPSAPVMNHFRPEISNPPATGLASVASRLGSEPAPSGSVIKKQERIWARAKGANQRSF